MFDSDGNCISTLEKLLNEKQEKRSWFERYFACCFYKKYKESIIFGQENE